MVDFAITKGIDVRFIETMPIGLVGIEALEQHISEKDISAILFLHVKLGFYTPVFKTRRIMVYQCPTVRPSSSHVALP
jgi:molybdenum cofactor biosynthesis enzyme MoaA